MTSPDKGCRVASPNRDVFSGDLLKSFGGAESRRHQNERLCLFCQSKAFCESTCRRNQAKLNAQDGAQERYATVS